MRQGPLAFVLVLLVALATACTSTETNNTPSGPMTSAVESEGNHQLDQLRTEFADIHKQGEVLLIAQSATEGPSACSMYEKYEAYDSVRDKYLSLGTKNDEFARQLATAIDETGRKTADAIYDQLKAGRDIRCKSATGWLDGTYAIKEFAKILDTHGGEGLDA